MPSRAFTKKSRITCPVLLSNFVSVLWKRSCISCSRDPSTLADSWARLHAVEARSPDLFNVAFQLFICHPMTVTWWEGLPCCVLASGHQPCQWFETQLQILSSEQSQSHTVGLGLHILTQCLDGFSCQIYQSLSCYLRIVPDSDLQFHRLWNQLPLSRKFQILKCSNTRATEFSLVYKRTRPNLRVLLLQGRLVPLKCS